MSDTFDNLKAQAQGVVDQVKDKVGDLADQHGGKVSDAVNQATDFIDDKTGVNSLQSQNDGDVAQAADAVQDAAKDAADKATGS